MLKLTPAAAMALTAARAEVGAPESYGVRFFAPRSSEGSPTRFGFDFVSKPEADDAVTEESGLQAFVAPEVASVGDATIDVEEAPDGARLVLRRETAEGA